ncbi:TrmH family RNA methyltransferase [Hoeflea prorocentri]|uniref:RNA methyltransferase n=1 Tax=Hoeflea prorocentri TaxID=1922333 RepID=A0A9X3UK30_9HYPH|nr:RNA methyltransferase [Hoeflea prorocentri]MCY6382788.1 RNA methyltransferase [Hoeflea prorocentri]MDA5400588.1 RNA methyltransferase [Hoeflea prorocentri]
MTDRQNDRVRVGRVKEITSLTNPIIKDIRALAIKKNRDRSGLFLSEGQKLVIDAMDLGWTIRTLVYAKSAKEKAGVASLAARAVAAGALVLEVSEKVLSAITRRDNPQMVCGVFEQQFAALADLQPKQGETYVALDRVRDPGNLGTIMRTADAAGASAIILVGDCTDPFSLETTRATMGSVFAIPVARTSVEGFLKWCDSAEATLVGTHLEGSVDYRTIDYAARPVVLLMGNEQAGLPESLAQRCDKLARIPQAGRADSLNLAVATGVMLFEARRHALEV